MRSEADDGPATAAGWLGAGVQPQKNSTWVGTCVPLLLFRYRLCWDEVKGELGDFDRNANDALSCYPRMLGMSCCTSRRPGRTRRAQTIPGVTGSATVAEKTRSKSQ